MALELSNEWSFGICDWGCNSEGELRTIAVDGRIYQVCRECLEDLQERFSEEEDW